MSPDSLPPTPEEIDQILEDGMGIHFTQNKTGALFTIPEASTCQQYGVRLDKRFKLVKTTMLRKNGKLYTEIQLEEKE